MGAFAALDGVFDGEVVGVAMIGSDEGWEAAGRRAS